MKEFYPASIVKLMLSHYNSLNEKGRRHYAALEALKLGRGGTTYISRVLPIHRSTITAGKKEIQALSDQSAVPSDRQRSPGGGRKKNTQSA